MSYGEQILWAERVLENPNAARLALDKLKYFRQVFETLYEENLPSDPVAQRFFKDMLANMLMDFSFEIRSE